MGIADRAGTTERAAAVQYPGKLSWSNSLSLRLLALGLMPLLVALPGVIAVLWLALSWVSDTQFSVTLRGNLAGAENYLMQLRKHTGQQLSDYAKSERLLRLLQEHTSQQELELVLKTAAQGRGLSYLTVATPDGVVIAASAGAQPGTHLPDSYVLRQAGLGMSNAAFERFDQQQLPLFSPQLINQTHLGTDLGTDQTTPLEPKGLLINAAAHLPLGLNTPDAILIGGVLLNANTSLVERIREIVFPVISQGNGDGLVAIHADDIIIARSRRKGQTRPSTGIRQPPEIASAVLKRGEVWIGPIERDGVSYRAVFSPIVNGEGERVGMLEVASPDEEYRRREFTLIASVTGLLALTMLAISVFFLRTGNELTKRIQILNSTMNVVRGGTRHVRVGSYTRDDELGRLAKDFDDMLETIEQQELALRDRNDELQQLSQTLHNEHWRLDQVISGTRAGTWAWNVRSGEMLLNERWAEILGYTLQELQPVSIATWGLLTHPDDLQRAHALLQCHFQGETPYYDTEVRMCHKDGQWVWVHVRGSVSEWSSEGQPIWMFGTHLDITRRREAEDDRAELLQHMQHLSANVPGMLYQYRLRPDGSSHYPYASSGIEDVFGCVPEDVRSDADKVFAVWHPDDVESVKASIQVSARYLTPWHQLYRVRHPVKGECWVEGYATPIRNTDSSVTWHGYIHDVTGKQRDREQIKLAASVYAASHEGIIITDANQVIIDVNQSCTRITGYERQELMGHTLIAIFDSGLESPVCFKEQQERIAQDGFWKGEVLSRHKSGEYYPLLLSISTIPDDAGQISHSIALLTDIRQLKDQQNELDRMANYDALTGVPNRRLLSDRLTQAIAAARRRGTSLAVCMMDLDRFKPVNDTYGHESGDLLLIEIAQRLTQVLRNDETVGRLGGDEFVFIFNNPDSTAMLERVLETVRAPVEIKGATVHVSASMGVVYFCDRHTDGDQLLREADQALYHSKQQGRDRYTVFEPES